MKKIIIALLLSLFAFTAMAATTVIPDPRNNSTVLTWNLGPDVTVLTNSGDQTIFEVTNLQVMASISVEIANNNTNDLSAFKTFVRFKGTGTYVLIGSVAADYSTGVTGFIFAAGTQSKPTDTLVTLIKNTSGYLVLTSLTNIEAVKLTATSSSAGGSTVTVSGKMVRTNP